MNDEVSPANHRKDFAAIRWVTHKPLLYRRLAWISLRQIALGILGIPDLWTKMW
jgi:hypothetical protein